MTQRNHPLQAVFLDWAGTTVDYGSRAPTQVFLEIFRRRGIEITVAEAREPMGRAKHDHIAAVARMPRVAALWQDRFGHVATDAEIIEMYHEFLPLQKATLAQVGADVLPGVPETIQYLRSRGLKIGSTTGYTRELMDVVMPIAAQGGFAPDVVICADDVPAGRPAPWMNFLAAQRLNVFPMSAVLVVDDTPVGIEAGLNAGAMTAAITQTGNSLGLSAAEVAALPPEELQSKLARIEQEFRNIGADYTLASVAELPKLFDHF